MMPEHVSFIIDMIAGLFLLLAAAMFCVNIINMLGPLRERFSRCARLLVAALMLACMLACLYAALRLFGMLWS